MEILNLRISQVRHYLLQDYLIEVRVLEIEYKIIYRTIDGGALNRQNESGNVD